MASSVQNPSSDGSEDSPDQAPGEGAEEGSDTVSKAGSAKPRRRGRPRNVVPSTEYLERRERIVSVAAEIFREQGYEAGSLDDVADALDLRKASLYYYVKSKSELLYLIFDRAISAALTQLQELGGIVDPSERLEAYIRHQATLVAGDTAMFAVFFDQRAGLTGEYTEKMVAKERSYVHAWVTTVEAAMKSGTVPPGDVWATTQILLGMTSWTYKWFDRQRLSPEELADHCVRLALGKRPPN